MPVDVRTLPVDVRPLPVDVRPLPIDVRTLPVDVKTLPVDVKTLMDSRETLINSIGHVYAGETSVAAQLVAKPADRVSGEIIPTVGQISELPGEKRHFADVRLLMISNWAAVFVQGRCGLDRNSHILMRRSGIITCAGNGAEVRRLV